MIEYETILFICKLIYWGVKIFMVMRKMRSSKNGK